MSIPLLIFVALLICVAVLEFALFLVGRHEDTSKFPPGAVPTQPGHKPPPQLWFQALSAIMFILAMFLIWSIVNSFIILIQILIGSVSIVGGIYEISYQMNYYGGNLTKVVGVVCSAIQLQKHVLLLDQPSAEILDIDISVIMLSFITQYAIVFWVYLHIPESLTSPRTNTLVTLGRVFCAITIVAALVSQLLYRLDIIGLTSFLLIISYTILTPVLYNLLCRHKPFEREHRTLPSLTSSVAGSNVALTQFSRQRTNQASAYLQLPSPPRAMQAVV